MSAHENVEVPVPDNSGVWLAVAAGRYYEADLDFWTLKAAIGSRRPSTPENAHLDQLRARRRSAYHDLVTWTMTVEAERQSGGGRSS